MTRTLSPSQIMFTPFVAIYLRATTLHSRPRPGGGGKGHLYNGSNAEGSPGRGTFLRLKVYKRIDVMRCMKG